MNEPKRYSLRNPEISYGTKEDKNGEYIRYEEYSTLKSEFEKLIKAGDAMNDAISEIDPQRLERHRFMQMTDNEYLAVMKWRTAKDPNYNQA